MEILDVNLQGLVDRVVRLERQNRFWKLGGVLAVSALALSLVVGARAQQPETKYTPEIPKAIEAQSFLLRDASGAKRGELGLENGVPKIELYNSSGKVTWSTNPRMVTDSRPGNPGPPVQAR